MSDTTTREGAPVLDELERTARLQELAGMIRPTDRAERRRRARVDRATARQRNRAAARIEKAADRATSR